MQVYGIVFDIRIATTIIATPSLTRQALRSSMSPLQSSSSHAAPPSGVPSASGDLQTGPTGLGKFAGRVLVEDIDPVWLENLKRGLRSRCSSRNMSKSGLYRNKMQAR